MIALAGIHDLAVQIHIFPYTVTMLHWGAVFFSLCLAVVVARQISSAATDLKLLGETNRIEAQKNKLLGTAYREVEEQRQKIQEILSHIEQGIVVTNDELTIENEISDFMLSFYKKSRHDIVGAGVLESIFPSSDISANDMNQIESALSLSIGEDSPELGCKPRLIAGSGDD